MSQPTLFLSEHFFIACLNAVDEFGVSVSFERPYQLYMTRRSGISLFARTADGYGAVLCRLQTRTDARPASQPAVGHESPRFG